MTPYQILKYFMNTQKMKYTERKLGKGIRPKQKWRLSPQLHFVTDLEQFMQYDISYDIQTVEAV